MPRGDGTGPMGMGPMTGRAAGFCAGFAAPGYANPPGRFGGGFGRGGGFGGGRGRRNRYYATGLTGWQRAAMGGWARGGYPPAPVAPTHRQEMEMLNAHAEQLAETLEGIRQRIAELEQSAADSEE